MVTICRAGPLRPEPVFNAGERALPAVPRSRLPALHRPGRRQVLQERLPHHQRQFCVLSGLQRAGSSGEFYWSDHSLIGAFNVKSGCFDAQLIGMLG